MIYPKSPFCPLNNDDAKRKTYIPESPMQKYENQTPPCNDDSGKPGTNVSQKELVNIIDELTFAVTDLNLFLDTHPNDEEALKTFTTLAATLKSYKHDYVQKYGPLCATDSSDSVPFDWVSAKYKWPWEL